ncbi:MAG: ABC transporter ATP-binding protein [Rubrivivax sp.]|nr:ABC transporter ATP-binding protein [Rubrivivax sp.]
MSLPVPALALSGVSCTFISRDDPGQRYTAVRDVTLTVGDGEFVSVVGPTGCGKSTLLNVGAGLLAPSTGTVQVFGRPLQGINTRAGYMFQSESLMPWRTALRNVMAGLEFRGLPEADARRQAEDWLKRVGLGGFGDRYPHQLSGGMRKRTSLAQTLALDPDIILMDEPFSALDIQTRQLMENEVLDLWAGDERRAAPSSSRAPLGGAAAQPPGGKGRKAVLFITHDLDEAIAMSDRVVVLSAGPASHPIGEFVIDLPRPRDVAEVRTQPRFIELHQAIWDVLREEVLKGYQQQLAA